MLMPAVLLAEPVVLERRVARIDAVVAELARKSGRDLRVRRDLDDEAVFVALGPHPADETMTLLARTASARWARDGAAQWLERPADLRRRQAREAATADAQGLTRSRDAVLVQGDARPWAAGYDPTAPLVALPRPADDAAYRRRSGLSPLGRMMSRTLRAIPLADLASLAPGAALRYVPAPNRLQRPLPASAGYAQYVAERGAMRAAFGRLSPAKAEAMSGEMTAWLRDEGEERGVPLLQATRDADGDVRLVLRVVGPEGPALDLMSLKLAVDGDHPGETIPGYADWAARPMPVTGATASFVKAFGEQPGDPQEAARLRDPVANEPLAALMTEPMGQLAAAVGGEAIVALPDESARTAGEQLQVRPKLGEFADGLAKVVAFDAAGGVLVGHARRPAFSAAMKTDRTLLRGLLRDAARGIPRLDAVARYALAQRPDALESGFETLAASAAGVQSGTFSETGLFYRPNRDALRTWGALPPAAREAMLAGRKVLFVDLGVAAQEALRSLFFEHLVDTELDRPPLRSNNFDPTLAVDRFGPDASLAVERIERSLVATSPDATSALPLDAGTMGAVLAAQERGEERGPGSLDIAKARFLPATRTHITLVVRAASGVGLHVYLVDLETKADARPVPYGELPPEFEKALQKSHDAAQRRGSG